MHDASMCDRLQIEKQKRGEEEKKKKKKRGFNCDADDDAAADDEAFRSSCGLHLHPCLHASHN